MGVIVETTGGKVQGLQRADTQVFRGIPFARPPVGPLRFRPPEPAEPWSGVRDASRFGHSAPQAKANIEFLGGWSVGEQSEDCLYLNVVTPAADGARRPVMVWIHGGAYTVGSGSQPMYDPRPLVERGDVVVVSINYRLGALGFLHLAELCGDGFGACGNAATLDQVAALRWVRDNAAAFGGDPGNVTIFGESAGGMSVGTLLGTPAAAGLFQRAIAQSGAAHRVRGPDEATEVARRLCEELDVAPATLREVPVEAILEAQAAVVRQVEREGGSVRAFCPVVDGDSLPEPPIDAIRSGLSRDVSVIAGATRDEWKLFGMMDPKAAKLDEAGLVERFESRTPGRGRHFLERYGAARAGRPSGPADLFFAYETDRVFRVPVIRLLEAQRPHQAKTYGYLVTWESPMADGALGACHGIDVPFVFGNVGKKGADVFAGSGPEALRLCDRMMDAWLAFARTGDPTHADLSDWPSFDLPRRPTQIFDAECRVEDDPLGAEREAWDGVI